MARGNATGFPLDAKQFEGGGGLTQGGSAEGKDLASLLDVLAAWIKIRGVVSVPGDLPTTGMEDGDLYVVKESAGPGSVPSLMLYDGDSSTWKNVTSTGLPGTHASTHKHGGADQVATATPAVNVIPKTGATDKLDSWVTSGAIAATPSLRALGAGATDACAGDDARLSNARTPTAHAASHQNPAGGDQVNLTGLPVTLTGGLGVVWAAAVPLTASDAINRIALAVSGLLAPGGIP